MSLTDPVCIELDHRIAYAAFYELSPEGAFHRSTSRRLTDGMDAAWFTATTPDAADAATAAFTPEQARHTAAFLLGYANRGRRDGLGEVPLTQVIVRPGEPTSRTRRVTQWDLGNGGMKLRFHARPPFLLVLDLPAPRTPRRLTQPLAQELAQALLAGAREVDHAHVVAQQAVHADRTGASTSHSVRTWLDAVRNELPHRNEGVDALIERLRTVLRDEQSRIDGERFAIALGRVHGDLREQLDAADMFAADTIGHEEVAQLLFELARHHAIPIAYLTASSLEVRELLPDGARLTDYQWTRVARSREMLSLVDQASVLIREERLVRVRLALLQAGILCRGGDGHCGAMLDGEVAETWGFCPACRPADLATAVAAGCGEFTQHDLPNGHGSCRTCLIPLPPGYHASTDAARER